MIDSVNETSATTKKLPLVEQWKQFFRQPTLLEKSYYRFIVSFLYLPTVFTIQYETRF